MKIKFGKSSLLLQREKLFVLFVIKITTFTFCFYHMVYKINKDNPLSSYYQPTAYSSIEHMLTLNKSTTKIRIVTA